jgi:hypothetical protein
MATVQLADVYNPTEWFQAMQEAQVELLRVAQAGILYRDPRIDAQASSPGNVFEMPNYNPLTTDEPDYVTDDPTDKSTPAKIDTAVQIAQSAHMHKSWSFMDLARELASEDPVGAVINRVSHYWAANTEKRLIASLIGIMGDNIVSDGGDMVHAIHTEDGAAATDANLISAPAVIDAAATMGDHASQMAVIMMHSVVYTRLQKLNLIDYIPDARGEVNIPTYLGYQVIVDDSLAPRAGNTSGYVYTTILASRNVIGYGSGSPKVPFEIFRYPDSGNGGGEDVLHSRLTEVVHPWGFKVDTSAITSGTITPSLIDLRMSAYWSRTVQERKNIGLAFLTTNG